MLSQFTNTRGRPFTLASTTGPNAAENLAVLVHVDGGPDVFVNVCPVKVIVCDLFEAVPLVVFATYVHLIVPRSVPTLIVVLDLFTVTCPLDVTVVVYGSLLSLKVGAPFVPLIPVTLQLLKVWLLSFSVAVPGRDGFFVTWSLNTTFLHVTFTLPAANTALVPNFRPDWRIAPTLTLVPPSLLMVRTSCEAADAAVIGAMASNAAAPAAGSSNLRISVYLPSSFGLAGRGLARLAIRTTFQSPAFLLRILSRP